MEHEATPAAAPTQIQASAVIQAFVKLRDERAKLKSDYEEADDVLKAKMQKLQHWLKLQMQTLGTDQLSAHGIGTAYREISRKYSAADWTLVWQYIKENDRFDILHKRLGEGALDQILKDTGELPPGINVHQEFIVNVRRK